MEVGKLKEACNVLRNSTGEALVAAYEHWNEVTNALDQALEEAGPRYQETVEELAVHEQMEQKALADFKAGRTPLEVGDDGPKEEEEAATTPDEKGTVPQTKRR